MTEILINWTWLNLGVLILVISALGFLSNWLNGRYFYSPLIRGLYYFGALIHELSHALMCIVTGAHIQQISVFSHQPKVVHNRSKIPILGQALISLAPIGGGLLALWLINNLWLNNYLQIFNLEKINDIFLWLKIFFQQLKITHWESWLLLALSLNAGAMLGPSRADLKNMWIFIPFLFFVTWQPLLTVALTAVGLILINLIVQLVWRSGQIVFKKITS